MIVVVAMVVFGGVADSGAGGPVERLIEGDQQLVVFDVDDAVTRLSRVPVQTSGAPPRPRRAHAAWLSGRTMLVYGGFMQTLQEIQEGVLDAIDALFDARWRQRGGPSPRSRRRGRERVHASRGSRRRHATRAGELRPEPRVLQDIVGDGRGLPTAAPGS